MKKDRIMVFQPNSLVTEYCRNLIGTIGDTARSASHGRSESERELNHLYGLDVSNGLALETEHAIGIPGMDQQHRVLIGLYNTLMKNISKAIDAGQHGHAFTELFSYLNFHFSSEEHVMRQALYPEYRLHMREHRNLISTMELLGHRIRRRERDAIMLAKVIGQWLLQHVRIADRDLGFYLVIDSTWGRPGGPAEPRSAANTDDPGHHGHFLRPCNPI